MTMIHVRQRRLSASHGFTLVELLLAVAISAIIGLTVVMMLAGVGASIRTNDDIRRASVKRQVAILRLGSLTRCAAMVLSKGPDHVVLWKGDTTGNGKPNISELRRIQWDADAGEVWTYESLTDLPPASDTTYELNADYSAVTASLAGSALFPKHVTLQHVTDWTLDLDTPIVQSARMIRLHLTIESESGPDAALVISNLRVPAN